jgi:hypothetical protein
VPLKFALALAVSLVAQTALFAGKVTTDFDPAIDFSRFKTYSFVTAAELTKTGILSDPAVRERVMNFVTGILETRGIKEVPLDQKYDLAIRYWVALQPKREEIHYTVGYDYWGGYPLFYPGPWAWSYEEVVVRNFIDGILVVDLLEPKSKELLWRTYVKEKIEDRVKAYKDLKKDLTKAFASYPPSPATRDKMAKERARLQAKYDKQIKASKQ